MTKTKTTANEQAVLPPLRVAKVDYVYGKEMARLMKASVDVTDPMWTHFPKICAEPEAGHRSSHDLILHPSTLELSMPATTDGGPTQRPRSRFPTSENSRLAPHHPLEASFQAASARWPDAQSLTPFQLLWGLLREMTDYESEMPTLNSVEHHLVLDLRNTSMTVRMGVQALLYMMRELSYRSTFNGSGKPQHGISLAGRPAASIASPIPYSSADPVVDLGSSHTPQLRYKRLDLPMHTLAVGGSGTGKTHSVMIPQLKGHLAYRLEDGTRGAALVVDPKKELAAIAEDFLSELGERDRFFLAGRDGRLRLFSKNTTLSLDDRVSLILEAVNVNPNQPSEHSSWVQKSVTLLKGWVESHAIYFNATGRDLFVDLMRDAGRDSSRGKGYWFALRDIIRLMQEGIESTRWLHQRLMSLAAAMNLPPDERSSFQFLARYASMDSDGANQVSYVTGGLEGALSNLCDEALSSWLDLSPAPEMEDHDGSVLHDIDALINASKVIVFQPGNSPSHDTGTRLIKAQFYRAAMERSNLLQPILFMCDEFQRFITSDRESGEASLLDRCRAYRITAVLATQSVTALYDALSKRGDRGDPTYAVNCILSNIAHMFYFQTLDRNSRAFLHATLPAVVPSSWPHPLEVVPLSAMRVGEAYYVAPQGVWGRTKFDLAA